MSFQIHALATSIADEMFALSDQALAEISAKKIRVDTNPGFPCRVSLQDAQPGETMILFNYEHQANNTPFRSSHAIFVRQGAKQVKLKSGEVPLSLKIRPISIRAFNAVHDMVDADIAEGGEVHRAIQSLLAPSEVRYLHLHYAKPGCYAARVTRG